MPNSDKPAVIGMPLGSRCMRIERHTHFWVVWLSTRDYALGTYLKLYDNGACERVVVRADSPDDVTLVKPRGSKGHDSSKVQAGSGGSPTIE